MLLPFLILIVRLTFFLSPLLTVCTLINLMGWVSLGEPLETYQAVLMLLGISIGTGVLHNRALAILDSLKLPNWFPGKKYLDWKREQRKLYKQSPGILSIKLPIGTRETIEALTVLLVATVITSIRAFILLGVYENWSEEFIVKLVELWLVIIFLGYTIDTFVQWNQNQKRWLRHQRQVEQDKVKLEEEKQRQQEREMKALKQRAIAQEGQLTKAEFSIGEKHKSTEILMKACEPYFNLESLYDAAVFCYKHRRESVPSSVEMPVSWRSLRQLAEIVWFDYEWGEQSPVKKAVKVAMLKNPEYSEKLVRENLYKGLTLLVKKLSNKVKNPDQWDAETPKNIKIRWAESEARYEWIVKFKE